MPNSQHPQRVRVRWSIVVPLTVIVPGLLVCLYIWLHLSLQTGNSAWKMHEIGIGIIEYAEDHDEMLPALNNPAKLTSELGSYGSEISLNSLHPMLVRPDTDIRYLTNPALAGKKLRSIDPNKKLIVLYEEKPTLGRRVVAVMYQGFIEPEIVNGEEWDQLQRDSGIK